MEKGTDSRRLSNETKKLLLKIKTQIHLLKNTKFLLSPPHTPYNIHFMFYSIFKESPFFSTLISFSHSHMDISEANSAISALLLLKIKGRETAASSTSTSLWKKIEEIEKGKTLPVQ
jgi:hypothetical protein